MKIIGPCSPEDMQYLADVLGPISDVPLSDLVYCSRCDGLRQKEHECRCFMCGGNPCAVDCVLRPCSANADGPHSLDSDGRCACGLTVIVEHAKKLGRVSSDPEEAA